MVGGEGERGEGGVFVFALARVVEGGAGGFEGLCGKEDVVLRVAVGELGAANRRSGSRAQGTTTTTTTTTLGYLVFILL